MGISPLWTNLQRVFAPQPVPCPGEDFAASAVCLPDCLDRMLRAINVVCRCIALLSLILGVLQG